MNSVEIMEEQNIYSEINAFFKKDKTEKEVSLFLSQTILRLMDTIYPKAKESQKYNCIFRNTIFLLLSYSNKRTVNVVEKAYKYIKPHEKGCFVELLQGTAVTR